MDHDTPNKRMYQKLIHAAMISCARICIIPIQDWLGLDNSARMNLPGSVDTNWCWRLPPQLLTEETESHILAVTKRFGRANWDALNRAEKAKEAAKTVVLV